MFPIIFILIINAQFLIIYKAKFKFIEQFKIDKNVPWPWDVDYEAWRKDLKVAMIQ